VSQRSMRRAAARRQAADRRRETLRRRRAGLAVTAAIGAAALFAPAANAATTFEVNTSADAAADGCTTDPDGCTLRDAVSDANSTAGDDTITFAGSLTGQTITLTEGQITINPSGGALDIQGPGASNLTVAGDEDRIFSVSNDPNPVQISGLTLTGGDVSGDGGAITAASVTDVRVINSVLTGNTSSGQGGAIYSEGLLTVDGSRIEQNTASQAGGGIFAYGPLTMRSSTVSGNDGGQDGGGIASIGKYAQMQVSDSTISGNSAERGGGIGVAQLYKYENSVNTHVKHAVKSEISGTTISGNKADYAGGGIDVGYLGAGDHFTVTHSTISGNDGAAGDEDSGFGGGIHFGSSYTDDAGSIDGEFRAINSTISGNTADAGGGVSVGGGLQERVASVAELGQAQNGAVDQPDDVGTIDEGSVEFENSTIDSNNGTQNGGGVYLSQYDGTSPTIALTSTILADNAAAGAANDADRGDGSSSGGLDTSFSLVENPGDAPVTQSPGGSTLIGVDPQLGPLANNGGPTATHLPAQASPVVDKGKAPARLLTDQRGLARTVQGDVADAAGGDGTDIGAVEVQDPARNVVGPPITPPAIDNTAPITTLKVPKSLSVAHLIRGFNVTVSCNEPCSMTFRLFGSAPTGTLHSSGYNFRLLNRKIGRKAGKRKVHLRPCIAGSKSRGRTHVCRKRLTKALLAKPQQTFKVKLIVAAKDKAGNVSHRKRFIRIHR
jgi:predicted outer membrane repeat protein